MIISLIRCNKPAFLGEEKRLYWAPFQTHTLIRKELKKMSSGN